MEKTTSKLEKLYTLYEDTIVDIEKLLQSVIDEHSFITNEEEAAEFILREDEEKFCSML